MTTTWLGLHPGGGASMSFSLMVWHPEIETWSTRSQLAAHAVRPRQAFTSGSLRHFLCQRTTTLAAEAGCRRPGHLLGTGSLSSPKPPLFIHHLWPVRL